MFKTDLAIFDGNRQLVLTVEIKRLTGMKRDWAVDFRHNLLANGYPRAPFFLLATPDHFYLWKEQKNIPERTEPDYIVDAKPFLAPIYAEYDTNPHEASSFIFEQVVGRWIKSIIYPGFSDSLFVPKWVTESGLEAAILLGDVEFEIAA